MKSIETLIPPPVYVVIFLACMYGVDQLTLSYNYASINLSYIGVAIMAVSLLYGITAVISFFLSRTTADPVHPERTNTLVISGMYRVSRNPMYLAMASILFGFGLSLGNIMVFIFPILFVIIITRFQIKPEERVMEEKFGDEYRAYKKRVRRWL